MNKKRFKYYEEQAKLKGKNLLIEEFILNKSNIKLEILISGKLVESEGKQYEALAIVRNCPISKYTRNKNNRTYSRDLWEYVKKQEMYEGNFALADHPVEEGSVSNVWGIWHGLNLKEDGAFSDLYLIEEKPVRILKAGGSLGTSTVGYGEFTEDGETVDPKSYELERLGDIVLNPSQGTFATLENVINEQENKEKNNIFIKENTNNKDEIIQENKSEDLQIMSQLDKFNAKKHVKNALKEAFLNTNYKQAIEDLQETKIDLPEEFKEEKSLIDTGISEIQSKMESEVKNKEKLLQEKVTAYSELEAKYSTIVASMTEMTERLKKAEAVVAKIKEEDDEKKDEDKKDDSEDKKDSKVKEAEGDDKEKSDEDKVDKKKDDGDAKKEEKVIRTEYKELKEDRIAMEEDMKIMEEDMGKMIEDIKLFKEQEKELKSQVNTSSKKLKKAESHIAKLEKILEDEFDYEFTQPQEVITADALDGDEIIVDGEVYEPICEAEEGEDITGGTIAQSSFQNKSVNVEDNTNSLGNYGDKSKTEVKEPSTPAYDEDKAAEGDVKTPAETQVASTYSEAEEDKNKQADDKVDVVKDAEEDGEITEAEEGEQKKDDEEMEETEDEEKDEYGKEKIKEYVFNPSKSEKRLKEKVKVNKPQRIETTKSVLDFYLSVVKEKPALKDFRKQILESKSLTEAVSKVAAVGKKSNDMIKIQENVKKENLEEYKFKF